VCGRDRDRQACREPGRGGTLGQAEAGQAGRAMTMDCAHVLRFIDAYIDGEFDAGDRAEMERHLAACERCHGEARRQSAWKAALRARAPRAAAPYAVHVKIQRALDAESSQGPLWRRVGWRVAPALVAAGALALLVVRIQPPYALVEESILDHARD